MAIAGKVAITLSTENGGAWSADVTYDRLVAVKHDNNLYISRKTVANVEPPNDEFWFLALEGFGGDDVESILQAIENIIDGTTQVGNTKKLDGHKAEYFATQEALNAVQSTSRGTLSTAGWYRVAEYAGNDASLKGGRANSCKLTIKRAYNNNNNEYHELVLASVRDKQTIQSVNSKCNVRLFTKVRYAYDATNAYLEVYYNTSDMNYVSFEILHGIDYSYLWKAITPILTEETVEGVTVTTTYDIPANASPVTDLDLFSKVGSYANLDFDTATTTKMYSGSASPGYVGATNYPFNDTGLLIVEAGTTILQRYITWQGLTFERTKLNASGYGWKEWKQTATTADLTAELAKYLSLTGGKLTGALRFNYYDKDLMLQILSDGRFVIRDNATDEVVFRISKDNKNNLFVGTASGNLPLTGGNVDTLTVANKTVHHDGNSAKVHIGTSAPSDTTGNVLFINTSK